MEPIVARKLAVNVEKISMLPEGFSTRENTARLAYDVCDGF